LNKFVSVAIPTARKTYPLQVVANRTPKATLALRFFPGVPSMVNHSKATFSLRTLTQNRRKGRMNSARQMKVNAIVNNSFGFGGHNASLVAKKFKG